MDVESTGRGAAMLAGLGAGVCNGLAEVARMLVVGAKFSPAMEAADRDAHLRRWNDALQRSRSRSQA
jgi:glycerol kinase